MVLAEPGDLQLVISRHSLDEPLPGKLHFGEGCCMTIGIFLHLHAYVCAAACALRHNLSSECHQADRNPGMRLQSDRQEVLQASCCTCSHPTAGCEQGSQLMDLGLRSQVAKEEAIVARATVSELPSVMLQESCNWCYWERKAGWKTYIALFHTFL